jgi:hypothetical protein
MILWDKLMVEFQRMLTRLGAFRTIRTWHLRFDGKAAAISPGSSAASTRAVKELIDPSGRQVILVVTDCVSEAWHTGEAMKVLETWARTGPLAIVQPLSQRLWSRSAIACNNVQLLAPYPGAPNHRLIVDPGSHRPVGRLEGDPSAVKGSPAESSGAGDSQTEGYAADAFRAEDGVVDVPAVDASRAGVAIPILEMTQRWLASWAQLVSSTTPVYAVAAFTRALPAVNEDSAGPPQDEDPVRVVERFIANASPDAVRLAGLLAAAPLSLPLMRSIQHEMLPDSHPQQLAEVYLGGLLRSVTAWGTQGEVRHDTFDFLDGVRDVLLGMIRKSEALNVMTLVSKERGRSYGNENAGHIALVEVPLGTAGGQQLTTADAFYGTIKAEVLHRMGLVEVEVPEDLVPPVPNLVSVSSSDTDLVSTVAHPISAASPEAEPASPYMLSPPDSPPIADRLEHGITLLGTASSGKTTLLAALGPALTQRHVPVERSFLNQRGDEWVLVPTDDASAQRLITMISDLTANQIFPTVTSAEIQSHHWQLWGQRPRPWWQRLRQPEKVRVDLHVTDPSGEIFMTEKTLEESLIETLVRSRGIVFMFDPIREFEQGDAFKYVLNVVTRLAQRMIGPNGLADGLLPHHVSVCVSKFDDRRVFEAANTLRLLTVQPDDQFRFPRVADADARRFFMELCAVSRTDTARMAMDTIERLFRRDRIRYFVTSAIGLYINRRDGIFSFDDYENTIRADTKKIRGAIHPVNVAEPFIWLGGRLAAESLQRKDPHR